MKKKPKKYDISVYRAPLESVSLCTRFSGFSTISSFGFNRLSSKLVGMFLEIVPMFVVKESLELSQGTCLPILSLNG